MGSSSSGSRGGGSTSSGTNPVPFTTDRGGSSPIIGSSSGKGGSSSSSSGSKGYKGSSPSGKGSSGSAYHAASGSYTSAAIPAINNPLSFLNLGSSRKPITQRDADEGAHSTRSVLETIHRVDCTLLDRREADDCTVPSIFGGETTPTKIYAGCLVFWPCFFFVLWLVGKIGGEFYSAPAKKQVERVKEDAGKGVDVVETEFEEKNYGFPTEAKLWLAYNAQSWADKTG
ncbi:MAG: hypothetical protein Q9170_005426 [Blastenia crenularia]